MQAYFDGLSLPYVGAVYPARTYISESDYEIHMLNGVAQNISSANGSGAALVINMPESKRQRRAMTGRGAVNDTDIHRVVLEAFFACTSGDPLQAQADNDTVLDAIVIAIRTDPLLGTGGNPIWSAGEFEFGIQVLQSEPFTDEEGLTVFIPNFVELHVYEWVAGQVPR